jgi:major membrane immunogen (membrane-anchored lipoprotein)
MKREKRILIAVILAALILIGVAYFVGFMDGAQSALAFGLSISKQFINITFNEAEISRAMYMYQNNIGTCWGDLTNASIRSN